MAIYMPPISRKKRVSDKYNPDSFRVISLDAERCHPRFQDTVIRPLYDSDPGPVRFLPNVVSRETRVLPHTTLDCRAHNPHPTSCGFLRHNARLLNEPVCNVYTHSTYPEQHRWWPSRSNKTSLTIPPYTLDTVYRTDFEFDKETAPEGLTRHTANPNKEPALGSVPVNFLPSRQGVKRLFKEGISYEHQYDSRKDPNYPIRSKRHGAFVWDQVQPDKAQLLIDYHTSVEKRRAAEAEQAHQTSKDQAIESQQSPSVVEELCQPVVATPILPRNEEPICESTSQMVPPQSIQSPPVIWPLPTEANDSQTSVQISFTADTSEN